MKQTQAFVAAAMTTAKYAQQRIDDVLQEQVKMGIERRIQIMESSAKITETWKKIAEDQAQVQREKSNSGMAPPPANPNFRP